MLLIHGVAWRHLRCGEKMNVLTDGSGNNKEKCELR